MDGNFTCLQEEDEKLKRLVEVHGERWDYVASQFSDRADVQCQHRWQKVVNPELVKGELIHDNAGPGASHYCLMTNTEGVCN